MLFMRRILNWQFFLGVILIALSAAVYFIHYAIFRDVHHIFIYLIGDIGFVFFEVLLVTLVLHQLLHFREKRSLLNKLNMIIGAFFSEAGTELLRMFSTFDPHSSEVARQLIVTNKWSEKRFRKVLTELNKHDCSVECKRGDLVKLRDFLIGRRNFMLRLLENPNLLEHESFTNLLWAIFHLTEELARRRDLKRLPDTDYAHIAGDIKRAYSSLISEWLSYMKHLKRDYPYLFSLAVRTNPFDARAEVEVR